MFDHFFRKFGELGTKYYRCPFCWCLKDQCICSKTCDCNSCQFHEKTVSAINRLTYFEERNFKVEVTAVETAKNDNFSSSTPTGSSDVIIENTPDKSQMKDDADASAGNNVQSMETEKKSESQPEKLSPLAQKLVKFVRGGGTKEEMVKLLDNFTKAERREARETIAKNAKATDLKTAKRFLMDMDAAEKAMLSEHIYTVGKPDHKLNKKQKKVKEDFKTSGWSEATPAQLKDMGISNEDLILKGTNYRAQVYIPDKAILGKDAKPVVAFKGTENFLGDDMQNNISQALKGESDYYQKAMDLAQKLSNKNVEVEITGHSLGGGLAAVASIIGNFPATTFNAASVNDETIGKYLDEVIDTIIPKLGSANNIKGYQVEGELLTWFQENSPVPEAPRNENLDTTIPKLKSQYLSGLEWFKISALFLPPKIANISMGVAITLEIVERGNLHRISQMRSVIEERKKNDLHRLCKGLP